MESLQRDLDLKSREVERLHHITEQKDEKDEKLKQMTLTYDELRNKSSLFKYDWNDSGTIRHVMEMH